jgi:glucokinase
MQTVLALDIGGTKIAGGIIDESGKILLVEKIPTPTIEGGPAILGQAAALLFSLQSRFDGPEPLAIGISSGGQINASGQIIGGTDMIPDWVGFPLGEKISQQFGMSTIVLNDGQAAALAESHFGAGHGRASMLCIVIGTGLGGGLVVDGNIQHGANGLAGSVGQIKISRDGCSYIPLEEIVSGPGLVRLYQDQNLDLEAVTALEVAGHAQNGDKHAREAIQEMGTWLGLGLSHALHTSDAECVVVGGSVAQIGDPFLDATRTSLEQYGYSTVADTVILPAKLGVDAGLIGAAVAVFHHSDRKV